MQTKKCRNKIHDIPDRPGSCERCQRQKEYRYHARRYGQPFCDEGHGLVFGNTNADGECLECMDLGHTAVDPNVIRSAPPTWLDWVAVQQAMTGHDLVRALSKREILCMIVTLRSRNPEFTREDIVDWIGEATRVPSVTRQYVEYLEMNWGPRRSGLARPALTVTAAMHAEIEGTIDEPAEQTAAA